MKRITSTRTIYMRARFVPQAVKGRGFCIAEGPVGEEWLNPFSSLLEDPDEKEPQDIPHVHGATCRRPDIFRIFGFHQDNGEVGQHLF